MPPAVESLLPPATPRIPLRSRATELRRPQDSLDYSGLRRIGPLQAGCHPCRTAPPATVFLRRPSSQLHHRHRIELTDWPLVVELALRDGDLLVRASVALDEPLSRHPALRVSTLQGLVRPFSLRPFGNGFTGRAVPTSTAPRARLTLWRSAWRVPHPPLRIVGRGGEGLESLTYQCLGILSRESAFGSNRRSSFGIRFPALWKKSSSRSTDL
jgi:hypothetical protein